MRRNLRRISLFSLLAIVIGLAGMVPAGATLSLLPDDTWGTNNQVSVILRVGGTIYLGGEFTALEAGQRRHHGPQPPRRDRRRHG